MPSPPSVVTSDPGADASGRSRHPVDAAARVLRGPMLRAVAAGLLIAGSLPPWGWWPLAFAGLAILDRLLAGASARARLGRGAVVGVALFAPTVIWISQLTAPGYAVAVALFAGLLGVACVAVPPNAGRAAGLAGAWLLCESVRMAWPFGGVPLSLLAVGQVGGPLAGIARTGGVLTVAAATVALGIALSALAGVAAHRSASRRAPNLRRFGAASASGSAPGLSADPRREREQNQRCTLVVATSAGIALLALAGVAPRGHDTGRRIDVALVQGGGEQGTRAIDTDERKVFERHLRASERVPARLGLVLWPEDVVDTDGPVQDAKEGGEVADLAARLDAPVVVGTVEGVDDDEFRNSSQVVTADGEWVDRFIKVQRVPFGEVVPFRSLIERVAPDTLARRDATISHESGLLRTPAADLAVVISWEVFFGHRARSGVRAGGQLLYNPTNGSTYTGTFVQTQQVASSRLRAIETGRWNVQVSPTGFSAFVGPDGTVHQRTGQREAAVEVRRDVPLRDGRTWYVRWGDGPARLLAVALMALAWGLAQRARPVADVTDVTRDRESGTRV